MSHPILCRLLQLIAVSASVTALLVRPGAPESHAQVLDRQKLLDAETFWDNRDWDWYQGQHSRSSSAPTRHQHDLLLPLGAGHQAPDLRLAERPATRSPSSSTGRSGRAPTARSVARPVISFTKSAGCATRVSPGTMRATGSARQALSRAATAPGWPTPSGPCTRCIPAAPFTTDLLPDLVKNYEGWEKRHFVADVGLFWQTGHDDGMEFNINSRQTTDPNAGAPGYRPTLNAYLWADALAIARIADLAGDGVTAKQYRDEGAHAQGELAEEALGPEAASSSSTWPSATKTATSHTVKAGTLTYQTGKYAGSPARPRIDRLRTVAVQPARRGLRGRVEDPDGPRLPSAPSSARRPSSRNDPLFQISKTCCGWSGQSWPYATAQTLKAMANLLQNYKQTVVSRDDYLKLLQTYARTHRKNGQPYIAEACSPRHRLVGRARHLQPQRALLPLELQRPGHHRPGRPLAARRRHDRSQAARSAELGLLRARRCSVSQP